MSDNPLASDENWTHPGSFATFPTMKALIQTGSSLAAWGHAQAGGRVPVPPEKQSLGLMMHANGRVQVRRLAWHGSSGRTQESHGHPRFSPDDRWVVYNSDVEKCNNVYMADVQSL